MEREQIRVIPMKDELLTNKKVNDLVYGFYQSKSQLTNDRMRYVLKKDCTLKAMEAFYSESSQAEIPLGKKTFAQTTKLLIQSGLLEQTKINNRIAYIIPDQKERFVTIKLGTLEYLVATATVGVIKTYSYLKWRYSYKQSIDGSDYLFSYAEILSMLGYKDVDKKETVKKAKHILDCLINNKLITIEEVSIPIQRKSNLCTRKFALKNVNEDYNRNLNKKTKTDDINIIIPSDKF